MFNGLYDMFGDAKRRGALPREWRTIGDFMAWARENKYEARYGYKGEFCPESLKLAMLPERPANDLPELDAETLVKKNNLESLKTMAAGLGINCEAAGADTKRKIAELIANGGTKRE
jgi:hypothetical protein